ncbi:Uncharacterized conserved protein, DUF305 family [Streptomyces sp. OV198]|jgi:uncharacterized protein (DUF305 family)|uniref:DUF305 domain-containing protein n=1 Tax=Streptomyces sp. OV198 TaxID=1882787 RepID=UPI000BCE136E|nr:DUF305 domain-containing protein [Streptomyces sp. OV198]SOE59524.1 Uncharacterized conserved protein, DUF305 family [Streptomyces sp. OV198]
MRNLTRHAALTATAVTAALVLAACGNDSGSNGSGSGSGHSSASSAAGAEADATTGAHNAQDVSFAQGMIPHHQQALQMAKLAADRASSAEVKDLASRIEKAQDPEIKTMSGWLKSWGKDVPSSDSSMESMPGMDDSAHSGMPGMMDSTHMDKLEKASGKDFDTVFLTMMIDHHKGAVEMATTEKNKGKYEPATSMADNIITAQTAEIAEMNKLLGKS